MQSYELKIHKLVTYVALIVRSRIESRAEWVLKVLGKYLPSPLDERPLLLLCLWQLGKYFIEVVVFGAALFGLLQVSSVNITLSLMFASLLVFAIAVGVSTVKRTIIPADQEYLMVAPTSERFAYTLAFASSGILRLLDEVVILPVVCGIAATIVLGDVVFLPALWFAIFLTIMMGLSLSVVADRCIGSLKIRRAQQGARSASIVAYVFFSAIAFGVGGLISRVLIPWLSNAPWSTMLNPAALLLRPELVARWASSLQRYVVDTFSFIGPAVAHSGSPAGLLARAAVGNLDDAVLSTIITSATIGVAALLWLRSGQWYRIEWQSGWQNWRRRDLFNIAEAAFLTVTKIFYPRDSFIPVQLHNLCRRREWVVASVADLFGGSLNWIWVGVAFGAAPFLADSPGAAAIFALLVGERTASESARGPFVDFKESLVLDAEGRQAGLYRVAGTSVLELYCAKLRTGRIISSLSLLVTLILIAIIAELPIGSWVLLFSAGFTAWVVFPHIELLPGLASPHFDWDHPEELDHYFEQSSISNIAGRMAIVITAVQFLLIVPFANGWVSTGMFSWLASLAMILVALIFERISQLFSRKLAHSTDLRDFTA